MPIPVKLAAHALLAEAASRGKPLCPLKLHKMLYFAQAHHLVTKGGPLFTESMSAWQDGPVSDFIYRLFPKETFKRYNPIPGKFVFPQIAPACATSILVTTSLFLSCKPDLLVKETHRPGSPWHTVWQNGAGKNRMIPKYRIKEAFQNNALTTTPMITLSHSIPLLAHQGIVVDNEAEVTAYLATHPNLEQVLNALLKEARDQLPADVEFSLECYHDHEAATTELILWARLDHYPETFGESLTGIRRSIRNNPLTRRLAQMGGHAHLSTDFGRPHRASIAA